MDEKIKTSTKEEWFYGVRANGAVCRFFPHNFSQKWENAS